MVHTETSASFMGKTAVVVENRSAKTNLSKIRTDAHLLNLRLECCVFTPS